MKLFKIIWGSLLSLLLTFTSISADETLSDHSKQFNEQMRLNEEFLLAVEDSDYDAVESFLKKGVNVEIRAIDCGDSFEFSCLDIDNANFMTPLMIASRSNDIGIIEALIHAGADVNAKDNAGKTPLMYAAERFGGEIAIKFLISSGADVDGRDSLGKSALMYAAEDLTICNALKLIQSGARIDFADSSGITAIDIAGKNGSQEVLDLLKRYYPKYTPLWNFEENN